MMGSEQSKITFSFLSKNYLELYREYHLKFELLITSNVKIKVGPSNANIMRGLKSTQSIAGAGPRNLIASHICRLVE